MAGYGRLSLFAQWTLSEGCISIALIADLRNANFNRVEQGSEEKVWFSSGNTMRFRWELLLILCFSAATVWLAVGGRLPEWLGAERETPVEVAQVKKRTIAANIRLTGRVVPVREVNAVSRLAGRVSQLRFKEGDDVNVGVVIATIDAHKLPERKRDIESEIATAQKDLSDKERQLVLADDLAKRRRSLYQQDLIARREAEQAEAAAQTARAQTELARARLALQQAMLRQTHKIETLSEIRAPVDGVIYRRWVDPGAAIAESSPIFTIADAGRVKVVGHVAGEQSSALHVGLPAAISRAAGDEPIRSQIARLVEAGKSGKSATDFEVPVQGAAAKLRLGAAVSVLVTLDRMKDALLVPHAAIVEQSGKHYLFRLVRNHAQRQEIEIGESQGNDVVIERGVAENDVVIVDPLDSIKAGSRVRPAMGSKLTH